MRTIAIKTDHNDTIVANVYDSFDSKIVVIIASATGVKQTFYKQFSENLSKNKITVITFDYIGIGLSLKSPLKEIKNTASDWGKIDLEAVIQYSKRNYPTAKLCILGHSIGGQLIGFAKSAQNADKIILVAAQSGYWKFWEGKNKYLMWFNWYILFVLLIKIYGYLPAKKFSKMENLPKNVAKQWSKWCQKTNYFFDDSSESEFFFKNITSPILAISIEKDFYAPKKAVNWLTDKFINAKTQKVHLTSNNFFGKKVGHFELFNNTNSKEFGNLIINYVFNNKINSHEIQ